MHDSEVLNEVQKARLTLEPLSAEELEKTIAAFFRLEGPVLAKFKQIIVPKK